MLDGPSIRRLRRSATTLLLVLSLLPATEAVAAYRAATAGCIHGAMSACCCTKGCARLAKPGEGMQCHRTPRSESGEGACFRSCSRDAGDATFTPHVSRFKPSEEITLFETSEAAEPAPMGSDSQLLRLAAAPPAPPPRSL